VLGIFARSRRYGQVKEVTSIVPTKRNRKTYIMFASLFNHHKPGTSPVSYTLRRYLTMRVLATAMFVAFAVLASVGGKESQTKQPSFNKGTIADLTIRHQDQGGCADVAKPGARKKSSPMISWQSVATMVNNFKDAFNDPSLIEYANQQGIDIPDSTTTSLLNTSSQPPAPSKSPSSQSSSSSSNY
jgi:hypothetical protein